jgi:iron complex outermembrane recepter protein
MKTKHPKRRRPPVIDAALTGSLAIFAGREVAAQQTPPATSGDVASTVQEIIVTASRRSTTVEDIPYNISAISGDDLNRAGVTDFAELAEQVAGFNYEDRGARFAGSTVPIIRGINGSNTERPGIVVEQMPVAIYLGNSQTVGYLPIMDIDHVEVLRGPQGTLYGAGSLGGAIRLIPKSPTLNEWSATVETSAGDVAHSSGTDYYEFAILNAPLGPIAALRLSGRYEHEAGFIDQSGIMERQGNVLTGVPVLADPGDVANSPAVYYSKNDVNYDDSSSGRASFLLVPSEALRVQLDWNGSYLQGVNSPQDNPSYPGGPAPWDPRSTLPATNNYQIVSSSLAPYFRHTDLTNLDASYDAGFATVASTTAYGETWAVTGQDANVLILGLPSTYLPYYTGNPINPRYVATSNYTDTDHRFTQELRLVSKSGEHFDYVVGAFYEHDTRRLVWDIYEPGTTAQSIASGGLYVNTSPDGHTFYENAPQEFNEEALYGELTWHLSPKWQVTGGGRVFHDTLSQDQDFHSYIIDLSGGNSSSTSNSHHIFKLNTSYEVATDQRIYATFSQGFRRGGVNAFPLSGYYQESAQILNYKPDTTDNYEIGVKGALPSGLRYSTDVYYINWNDPQMGISTPNTWPVAINGKTAVSKGFELEINTPLFVRELELMLAYSYTDARLTQSFCLPGGNGTGVAGAAGFFPCGIEGFEGERLPGTTDNDGSVTLTYSQHFGTGHAIIYTINDNYRGSSVNNLVSVANNAIPPITLGGYALLNASISAAMSDHLRIGLFGSNLLDKRAVVGAPQRIVPFLGDLANIYSINRPREVSLRIAYDW